MTIKQEGNKLNPDTYLELWDFDATLMGGTTYYYTNMPVNGSALVWRGNSYYPLPFEVTGIDNKADGTAPSRPTLTVSNVGKAFQAAMLALGSLTGMKVTRWRTFYKYTDAGSEPNTSAYYPIDEFYISKKNPSSLKTALQFELCTMVDRPGMKLPYRLILRDLGFPGVSRTRIR